MSFRIQNLSFQYGNTKALQDVSFEFEPASRIALVGANGAGKSTLMALISGLFIDGKERSSSIATDRTHSHRIEQW